MNHTITERDLVSGPRGQRVCWELLSLYPLLPGSLDDEGFEQIANAAWAMADRPLGEVELLHCLGAAASAASYWSAPDELPDPPTRLIDALEPLGSAILSSTRERWWAAPVAENDQAFLSFQQDGEQPIRPELTPMSSGLRAWLAEEQRRNVPAAGPLPLDEVRMLTGTWWSTPAFDGAIVTTKQLPDIGPVRLHAMEDPPQFTVALSWPVTTRAGLRVFEIRSPADWVELVLSHPLDVTQTRQFDWRRATGRIGRWLIPDWLAVSEHYDAVHLSAHGYLSTAGRPLLLDSTTHTLLAGWSPDETYWLADSVTIGENPSRYRGPN